MQTALIVNARRCSPALLHWLRRSFRGSSSEMLLTTAPGHAEELSRSAVRSGAQRLIAVGGDGTIHEVVNGLAHSEAVLGVLPTGTANDFAAALGLPGDLESAARICHHGQTRDLDLLSINRRYYVTTAGIGLPARVIARRDRWRCRASLDFLLEKTGIPSYELALLCEVFRRGFGRHLVRIIEDGIGREGEVFAYLAGHVPALGHRFRALPSAQPDRGVLFTCAFGAGAGFISAARAVLSCRFRRCLSNPRVRAWQGRMAVVESDRPLAAFADGELVESNRRFVFGVHPRALRVLANPKSEVPCLEGRGRDPKKTARLRAGGSARTIG